MCLIIHGAANKVRDTLLNTAELLDSIYDSNPDGLGVMYRTTKGARVRKWLPRDLQHATELVRSFPDDDRELAVHWRWRTHGDIDKENCHPYPVDGGFLMHNGVLSTGNDDDTTKSDTWHYVHNFLGNGVMERLAHEPNFIRLLTDHIGDGNKFVMMTADGRMSIAGVERGIKVGDLWFSNTYAWEPHLLIPGYRSRNTLWGGHGSYNSGWGNTYNLQYENDPCGGEDMGYTYLLPKERDAWWAEVLADCDAQAIHEVLSETPRTALTDLFDMGWLHNPYKQSDMYPDVMGALHTQNVDDLVDMCKAGRVAVVSEGIAYYSDWRRGTPRRKVISLATPKTPAKWQAGPSIKTVTSVAQLS